MPETIEAWQPGQEGKGLVFADGSAIVWATKYAMPGHGQVFSTLENKDNPIEAYIFMFPSSKVKIVNGPSDQFDQFEILEAVQKVVPFPLEIDAAWDFDEEFDLEDDLDLE